MHALEIDKAERFITGPTRATDSERLELSEHATLKHETLQLPLNRSQE